MKKRLSRATVLIVLVATLALICLAPSPVLGEATPQHDAWTDSISDLWVLNQCTGEWLVCEGTVDYAVHQVADASGGSHWMFRGRHNLRGVAASGNEYQVISTFVQRFNVGNSGIPYEWTFVNTSPLISHGKDTNMRFYVRNKVTYDANGELRVSFSEVWIDCSGS